MAIEASADLLFRGVAASQASIVLAATNATIGIDDSIRFSIVKLAPGERPRLCPLCTVNAGVFEYTRSSSTHPGEELKGQCCLSCTQRLLATMQELAIAEWTENLPPG